MNKVYRVKIEINGNTTYAGPRDSSYFSTKGGATQALNRRKRWQRDVAKLTVVEMSVGEPVEVKTHCSECGKGI